MVETISTYTPTHASPPPQDSKKKLMIIIGAVVVLALIGGGIFMATSGKSSPDVKPDKVAVTATPEPTPTAKPEIDKSKVKIQVKNGTGTPGQAGSAVDILKKAGYSAENIKTGNAEKFGDVVTSVKAKKDFEDVAKDIKDALEPTFKDAEVESSLLDADSDFDIVVVTGGKKYVAPTTAATTPTVSPTSSSASPTVTPTPKPSTTTSPTATPTVTPTKTPTPSPTHTP